MPELPSVDSSKELCFFCSGHLPCRVHNPTAFADVDFQQFVMGEISAEELFELQGVGY